MSKKSRAQLSKDPASYATDYLNHVLNVQSHDVEKLQSLFKDCHKAGYDQGYQASARKLIAEGKVAPKPEGLTE